jgi:hypothetical protein
MSNIRVKLSRITTKKVPALSLVVVGLVGMVLGVLAATITITQMPYLGEIGTYHTNSATMAITDKGLSVESNSTIVGANTTGVFGAAGNKNLYNGASFVGGHWVETILLQDTAADTSVHTVTIKISGGPGSPNGMSLESVTLTLTGPGTGGGAGTITDYVDLGTTSISSPLTVYVSST